MTESVVAKFKQEQALQEQAAQQGLYGVALVASHELLPPVCRSVLNVSYTSFKKGGTKKQRRSFLPRNGGRKAGTW